MTRTTLTLFAFLITGLTFSQSNDSTKFKKDSFDNYQELREKQKAADIDKLTYLDSTFNFQVQVPNWLNLKETGTIYAWGGTLPAVESIENAILIKIFDKSDYKSLADFKKYIIGELVFGQSPNWSNSHKFMGKKDLGKYKNIGEAYKIYLLQGKIMYHCEYILLETKTAYLWIDFTSTPTTFDVNIGKFEEFMSSFTVTDFY